MLLAGFPESVRTAVPDSLSQEPRLGKTEPKKGRSKRVYQYQGGLFPLLSFCKSESEILIGDDEERASNCILNGSPCISVCLLPTLALIKNHFSILVRMNPPEILLKCRFQLSSSGVAGGDLGFCISNKLPSDAGDCFTDYFEKQGFR